MSNNQQTIVKEVLNFSALDYKTNLPLFYSNYASVTTNDVKTTRIEVRGGQGNYLLGTVDHSKTVTATITLPLVDLKVIAMLNDDVVVPEIQNVMQRDQLTVQASNTGTINVTAGATTAGNASVTVNGTNYIVAIGATDASTAIAGKIQTALSSVTGLTATVTGSTVTLTNVGNSAMVLSFAAGTTGCTATTTVVTTNGVTLTQVPLFNSLSMFNLVGDRDYGTQITAGTPSTTPTTYSLTNQFVELNTTSNPIGSEVIALYQFATSATAQKVTIKANKFAKTLIIFGDGIFYDADSNDAIPVKVQMYKVRPQGNITFTMDGTKATELTLTCDLMAVDLPNGDKGFMEYVMLPDEEE